MELIVLEGDAHVGKTTTLNIVYQLLLQAGYRQVPGFFQDLANNDFLDVLEDSNKQRVGIVTQGDYAIGNFSVKRHLMTLDQAGCKKTVCARTYGPTKSKILHAIQQYPWITPPILKTKTPNMAQRSIVDNQFASRIFGYI